MNTMQILSAAYAEACGIPENEHCYYYGQEIGNGVIIDYTSFDRLARPFDIDSDTITASTSSGSEGVWIDFNLTHCDYDSGSKQIYRIGSIKTLDEGRDAWRNMGALAGEISYLVDKIAWKLYKAENPK